MLIRRTEIVEKINQYAGKATPFLFAIDFDGEKGFVVTREEANQLGIFYNIEGHTNENRRDKKTILEFRITPVEFSVYRKAFDMVMLHLKRGDTYLINLTFPTRITTDASPLELFGVSNAPYKLYVPEQFIVFSPEPFIRISGALISSHPMKGTIDASIAGAREQLLANPKELFEHHTIVDLIRNDLSMISTGVQVKRFRYLEKIHTNRGELWQMSSEITGMMPSDYLSHLGDYLFKILPAGSVTGAPKEKTVQIIRKAETYQRGFYTGIFGYFDGRTFISAVTIRYYELNREKIGEILMTLDAGPGCADESGLDRPNMVYKSGGGITALSDAESEYAEMLKKVYVPLV